MLHGIPATYITRNSRNLHEIPAHYTEFPQASKYEDWWWKQQLGKCYYRLGLYRDAEKQFQSALKQQPTIDNYLYLSKVFVKLDQPLAALELFEKGIEAFPGEISLIIGCARVHEGLGDLETSVKFYKKVFQYDASNVEAIACIGTHNFYSDMPEIALRSFRRLLQMGVANTELYNNIALCCFYAQQYDMSLTCFQRAIDLANKDNIADVWYNIGHVAVGIGDSNLGYQAFQLALISDNNHAEAYNNLAILEMRKSKIEQARAYFLSAITINQELYEAHYNLALLSEGQGDLNTSFKEVRKSLEAFPEHVDSKNLLVQLRQHFTLL